MVRKEKNPIAPLLIFFVILNGFFIAGKNMLSKYGADHSVLIIGNLILFIITLVSFIIAKKGLLNANPHAFVRGVYGSIMIKLFLCIIAVFVYLAIKGSDMNKPALFTLMGLYLVYTFIEISTLTKLLRRKANG